MKSDVGAVAHPTWYPAGDRRLTRPARPAGWVRRPQAGNQQADSRSPVVLP